MPRYQRGILHSREPLLSLLHRVLDLAFIAAAFFATLYWNDTPLRQEYLLCVTGSLFLFYLISDFSQLYGSWRGEHSLLELRKVASNWAATFAAVFAVDYFLLPSRTLPNTDGVLWFTLALVGLASHRVVLRLVVRRMRSRGFNTRSVAIAGAGPLGQRLANTIMKAPWMGLDLLGFYDDMSVEPVSLGGTSVRLPINGNMANLIAEAREGRIDKVYITLPMRAEEKIKWLVDALSDTTASVYLIPDVFVFDLLHARSESINGLPSISIFDTPMDGASRVIKRMEDVVLSSLILALIALPMLLIGLGVKLTSPGPALFRQQRYGIDGKPISVWKFRSMRVMEDGDDVVQATRGDARITRLGAFLRRTSLDELPQFVNVLLGDMSIVGPRPHAVAHNEEYRKLINGYMLRHKVKPGITGWAQVNGWRGETDTLDKMAKRIECDLDYIRHWSLWLDLKIVFMTVFKGFVNPNAY
ncbi:undecaprenyl-phosphate glucose phosphotransferase [Halopseudomonas nanhaiensis]|uniref:undecaprenyl-phosphate glucose phosphotransferase n=1 Tax=Halopseudomonas nanhaiensis TaxID=2830842 RepID=UPI001CBBFFD7|nr:undecaprenyl-phosphate glucose phosphotransferase [Halopseudomonas nanhaiensis]UAW99441.1 undecaprenyl-phosphate glucose phosphotransferase [Halopseudomonas nanhaiensis]